RQRRMTGPMTDEHDQHIAREPAAASQIGRRLREVRMSRGISLREMARRIGVSASFVSQVERGKSNPSVGTLYAFVAELGTSLDELTGDRPVSGQGAGAGQATGNARDASALDASAGDASALDASGLDGTALDGTVPGGRQMTWDPRTAAWPRISAPVQRAHGRSSIQLSGVVWERLTHDDDPYTDFLHVRYAPGSASCPEDDMMRHGGREY